ncbi:benzoate 4-monooxygenase cytochrome P450 [Zopfia rhizophila CBS 207.26]|uniref:Benzoate 4-monooxygenase cytochrome P450 n=1 Tax=Zopfia rhizophila CBS 207.26 TaxID=1314779 RepID=A0A6A6E3W0_9PEZI|nr:benzoate 4-monooxygenase cytochrome P450 [Zopfia rhizophila CBS 207.26]
MVPAPGAYNTHTCIDKDLHRHKRRVMGQAFSERALRAFEPKILEEANIFLHQLHQNVGSDGWSQPLNMSQIVRHMTIDVLGEFAFGRSFELQTQEKNRFLLNAINAASRVSGMYAQYPRLKSSGLDRIIKQRGAWTREKFGNLMLELVKQRISEKEDARHDLFSFIINAKDPETGKGFELNEIWAESRLLIIAGSDTTSTAICATLFYLSRYPDCKSKLTEEIESNFTSAEEIRTGPQLSSCHYLRACIDEAMRMSPPVGTALWREVCKSGLTIDGTYIPPGVDVGSSLYSIHHLESIFPDSWTYNPERWLGTGDSSEENELASQRKAFNPFSLGTRKCIAPTMAYTEASIALARMLWLFDFRRPDGELDRIGEGVPGDVNGRHRPKEFQLREHLTSTHEGPYLKFRCRIRI